MAPSDFQQSSLFVRWRPIKAARPTVSDAWWPWIASTDSLTARLIAAGGEQPFRVQLLRQGIGWPRYDEAKALGIGLKRYAWLREVALCVGNTPWVVARSVAPLAQLKGQRLDGLGERSLGSWLFRQPDLVRGPLEVTTPAASFGTSHSHGGNDPWAWGRRSVFQHGGLSLLVQEYFLHAMADELGLPSR